MPTVERIKRVLCTPVDVVLHIETTRTNEMNAVTSRHHYTQYLSPGELHGVFVDGDRLLVQTRRGRTYEGRRPDLEKQGGIERIRQLVIACIRISGTAVPDTARKERADE